MFIYMCVFFDTSWTCDAVHWRIYFDDIFEEKKFENDWQQGLSALVLLTQALLKIFWMNNMFVMK